VKHVSDGIRNPYAQIKGFQIQFTHHHPSQAEHCM